LILDIVLFAWRIKNHKHLLLRYFKVSYLIFEKILYAAPGHTLIQYEFKQTTLVIYPEITFNFSAGNVKNITFLRKPWVLEVSWF